MKYHNLLLFYLGTHARYFNNIVFESFQSFRQVIFPFVLVWKIHQQGHDFSLRLSVDDQDGVVDISIPVFGSERVGCSTQFC